MIGMSGTKRGPDIHPPTLLVLIVGGIWFLWLNLSDLTPLTVTRTRGWPFTWDYPQGIMAPMSLALNIAIGAAVVLVLGAITEILWRRAQRDIPSWNPDVIAQPIQFRITTALVVMLTASALLWLSLRPNPAPPELMEIVRETYGWPWPCYFTFEFPKDMPVRPPSNYHIDYSAVGANATLCAGGLVLFGYWCELFLRGSERTRRIQAESDGVLDVTSREVITSDTESSTNDKQK